MTVFFNIIDVAGVGALVIWLYNRPEVCAVRSRRKFLMTLGESLASEQIQLRLQNPTALQKNAKNALSEDAVSCGTKTNGFWDKAAM